MYPLRFSEQTLMMLNHIKFTNEQIVDAYHNPDKMEEIGPFVIIQKFIDEKTVLLMILDTRESSVSKDPLVEFIVKIYPNFIESRLLNCPPSKMLMEFMEKFGKNKEPDDECYVDYKNKIFNMGRMNGDAYYLALNEVEN